MADDKRVTTLLGRAFTGYPSTWDGCFTHGNWIYGPSFAVRLPDHTEKYPVGKPLHEVILKDLIKASNDSKQVTIDTEKHDQAGLKTQCKFRAVRDAGEQHTEVAFANLAVAKLAGVVSYYLGDGPNRVLYGYDSGRRLVFVSATKRAHERCLAW